MDESAARLTEAMDELYGVPPEEFVEVRGRLAAAARAEGDRELSRRITGLRRPTLSAWAVNRLSRVADGDLGRLLDTGAELRAAWTSGGGLGGLGALEERRNALLARLAGTVRRLAAEAGRPLREPALREVDETLQAATIDPEVAEEVRTGTLARPRSHSGFVPAGSPVDAPGPGGAAKGPGGRGDRSRAAARTARPPHAKTREGARERMTEEPAPAGERARNRSAPAGKRVAEAERADRAGRAAEKERAAEADEALREWESAVAVAQGELDALDAEAGRLRRELDEVMERRGLADRRVRVARRERDQAARRAAAARRRAAGRG